MLAEHGPPDPRSAIEAHGPRQTARNRVGATRSIAAARPGMALQAPQAAPLPGKPHFVVAGAGSGGLNQCVYSGLRIVQIPPRMGVGAAASRTQGRIRLVNLFRSHHKSSTGEPAPFGPERQMTQKEERVTPALRRSRQVVQQLTASRRSLGSMVALDRCEVFPGSMNHRTELGDASVEPHFAKGREASPTWRDPPVAAPVGKAAVGRVFENARAYTWKISVPLPLEVELSRRRYPSDCP
jgi:hypothetical protein